MNPRLVPVYFDPGRDQDFDKQLTGLKSLLAECAEILPPVALGRPLPEAEAVVFPQLLGEAYRRVQDFRAIGLPILIVTSEFGTLSMWDWEIICYLKSQGVETIAPYNLEQTKAVCRALRLKKELPSTKLLVYQDNPGEGAQASIFKRFYWWEDECTERMREQFGLRIVKKSFRDLGARAKEIPDRAAEEALDRRQVLFEGVSQQALASAMKLYLAVRQDLDEDPTIRAVGINCLNESHFSDTTPCLAWNLLFEEQQYVWGCEADTLSMLTQYLLYHALGVPIMMTNLYPFLMGQAALKHEHIPDFPQVEEPQNYILVAHCGYLGVVPTRFATEWTLRKKVLAIVDDNATAIDARLREGPITLAKLHPTMTEITVAEGTLTGYVQYPGSDCRNGGVIRVRDGRRLMSELASHHYLLMTGHKLADIRLVAKVLGVEVRPI